MTPIRLEDLAPELLSQLHDQLYDRLGKLAGLSQVDGSLRIELPRTLTSASYTVLENDHSLIANFAGVVTLTLPAASQMTGRTLRVRTITANTVVSASSNVVPLAGGAAGTAILAATAGKWADLQSDGTNWQIMAGN